MQQCHKISARTKYQIIGTFILGIILLVRLVWPTFKPDTFTTIVLVGILFLWLGPGLLKSMTAPGGWGIEFKEDENLRNEAKAKADEAINETSSSHQPSIKWDKVATLFWLGNDLMWIQDMTYRDAPPERVLQGVNNAIGYAEEFGFTQDSFPIQRLKNAGQVLQRLLNIPLATEGYSSHIQLYYAGIRQECEAVKWYIYKLAIEEQPDFKKKRAI